VEALAGTELRRIFTDTPPTPKSGPRRSLAKFTIEPDPEPFDVRYEIQAYLESGGTADVHVAHDRVTGGRCALKVLRTEAAESSILRTHFLVGARAAMRIAHPNIVRVLEVVEPKSGFPYAAMELLEGKALNAVVRTRALPDFLASEIALQAAQGLDAAHRAGVVHCDVKPENLFLTELDCGAPLVKILDFDLAQVDGTHDPGEHQVLRGTAKYMAPEQIVGDPVDGRTDVYALGVTLFRLLTGELPFDLDLSATLLRHQLYSPVPPVTWLAEDVDPRLDAIVTRATRKHPANRYQSAREMAADLLLLSEDEALPERESLILPDVYQPRSERGVSNAAKLEALP
jgi:serine/threonine-protein kinase